MIHLSARKATITNTKSIPTRSKKAPITKRNTNQSSYHFQKSSKIIQYHNIDNLFISKNGINIIKTFNKFKPIPAKDLDNKYTIGYGHYIDQEHEYENITIQEAEKLLMYDIQNAQNNLKKIITTQLTQNQFDILVSIMFNVDIKDFLQCYQDAIYLLNKKKHKEAKQCFFDFTRVVESSILKLESLEKLWSKTAV